MGYTLLDTLSELWFTQFFNSVLLCTCLLVSRVSFLFSPAFVFKEKKRSFFYFSILILIFWAVAMALLVLCHGT